MYPKKNGIRPNKKGTREKFWKVVGEEELPKIIIAVKNYVICEKVMNGYIKDPVGFVGNDFWKDHLEPEIRGINKQGQNPALNPRAEI